MSLDPKRDKVHGAAGPEDSASRIPRLLNGTGNFLVLGDLILPHPSTCGLLKEHEELVLGLQSHLNRMDGRDLSKIPKPIQTLKQSFEVFKAREIKIWKDLGLVPPPQDDFVRPSGKLNAAVMHHLNQPSYSTLNHVDGETADASNGCISMLMGNAFKKDDTLVFDDLHRRSEKSESYETYPQEVVDCHMNLTQDICASATAKVEIVYGVQVQKRVLRRWAITVLPLWGALSDVFLFLSYSLCLPPTAALYEPVGSDIARLQDSITLTAAKIAKNGTPCIKNYFLEKKWRDGSDLRRQIEIKALGATLKEAFGTLQYVDEKGKIQASSATEEEGWGCYFSSNPYSNDDLRRLLPSALQVIDEDCDKQWNDPSDFPEAIQEWFKGQKQILFYEFCIHSTSDIAKVFETSYMPIRPKQKGATKPPTFLLRDMLRCMMLQQTLVLGKVKGEYQDLYHSRFDDYSMETCCHYCNSVLGEDHNSRWSTKRPGFYIARQAKCHVCNGKTRSRKPASSNVAWIRGTRVALQRDIPPEELPNRQPARRGDEPWTTCMRREKHPRLSLPAKIESWCIRCKENSKHSKGEGVWIDEEPRWTLGDTRPIYIERQVQCLRCQEDGHASGIFVPVDDTPSIYTQRLTKFAKIYGAYDNLIKSKLFDAWIPSSKSYRFDGKN